MPSPPPIPPSAFPPLPDSPDELPAIPGGWREQTISLPSGMLTLWLPADPDLFLDDGAVIAENDRHDYMPYWAFLWPAAEKMAAALADADWPRGGPVLELGAGVGLAGLAALQLGDRVVFSDYDATALHVCRVNARRNGLGDPALLRLDWRRPEACPSFPVVIGCEVTYDANMHPILLNLLDRVLQPGGICWLADPGRYQTPFFCDLARERGYAVSLRDEAGRPCAASSARGFQIVVLQRID